MKYFITILFATLFISIGCAAQIFRKEDTVVVFRTFSEYNNGLTKEMLFKKGYKISWVDSLGISHKSVIENIKPEFLLLDADTIYPGDIKAINSSGPPSFFPPNNSSNMAVIVDTGKRFQVMTFIEFEKLTKTKAITFAQNQNDPFYKHISAEKYAADMDKKIQRRRKMFAAIDTCPLHYGIKTNLVWDLVNEINLSFEIPVKRSLCIDVGAGILYATTNKYDGNFASVLTELLHFRGNHLNFFDHSYINRKGFSLDVISKFFLSKKKHLYIGPQLCFRYYNYKNKWVWLDADGSDYYHVSWEALQSEKSAAVQLNAMVGVQTPQIKRFIFDAFISVGIMYRGGMVSRSVLQTDYHEGSVLDYCDPHEEIKGGGITPSVLLGFKIGYRFGKARLFGK